jgi:hypothetical protein
MGALERSIEPFGIAGHEQISGIVLEKQDGHVAVSRGASERSGKSDDHSIIIMF